MIDKCYCVHLVFLWQFKFFLFVCVSLIIDYWCWYFHCLVNFGFVLLLNVVSFLADYWSLGMVDTKPQRCRLTTQQHTYLPVTTPGLPLTTLKMLNITQGRMLPQFTTPRNLSITLLRATTEAPVYYTTNASECYMIIYAALNYYTGASKCNTIDVQPICKQG
jgi:hypothetical protein